METLYTDKPDGLCGNDDAGQMSAWYVLSAMGFYPVTPGMDYYVIGSPLLDEVTIHLEDGNDFVIKTRNNSKENKYVQGVTLNGKPYPLSYLKHEDIMKGGVMEFEMGPEPNKKWGVAKEDRPYSDSYRAAPVPRIIFDDVSFLNSMKIEIVCDNENAVITYTLDGTEPDENSSEYVKPITLTKTTTVKARTWIKGLHPGYTVTRKFRKIDMWPAVKISGLKPGLRYEYKEAYALIFADTKDHSILGAIIVGNNADMMIQEVSIAIYNNLKLEDMEKTVHIHPTYNEMIHESILDALGSPLHKE